MFESQILVSKHFKEQNTYQEKNFINMHYAL